MFVRFVGPLYIYTPVLSFVVAFAYMVVYHVAGAMENPFGDDLIDLPVLETHKSRLAWRCEPHSRRL